jgi:tight adherence protein C
MGGFLLGALVLWALYALVRAVDIRRRGIERIEGEREWPVAPIDGPRPDNWLARWLALAGFRRTDAPMRFTVSCVAALLAGIVLALLFRSTVLEGMIQAVSNIPGGVGESLAAILEGGPLVVFVTIAIVPVLFVRKARRTRVREVERDLPLTLELFATLAEAGLGFDAALSRIVASQPAGRPLTAAFVGFQRDMQAGVGRVPALRRLAAQLDVMPMTVLSAIIQSEQVGASLAETLRHQSDDLRVRRRELALLQAQALPVKLVFPLVACFLPGIFLSTLGPVLYQMIQVADSVLRPVTR